MRNRKLHQAEIITRSVSEVRPDTSLTLRVVIGCIEVHNSPTGGLAEPYVP